MKKSQNQNVIASDLINHDKLSGIFIPRTFSTNCLSFPESSGPFLLTIETLSTLTILESC